MKRTRLVSRGLFLVAALFVFSCTYDPDLHVSKFDKSTLNKAGKEFMEVFMGNPEWESEWDKLMETGTPHPNEALVIYNLEHQWHYIVPLVENRNIVGLGVVLLSATKAADGTVKEFAPLSTEIYDMQAVYANQNLRLFIETFGSLRWRANGLNIEKVSPAHEIESTRSTGAYLYKVHYVYDYYTHGPGVNIVSLSPDTVIDILVNSAQKMGVKLYGIFGIPPLSQISFIMTDSNIDMLIGIAEREAKFSYNVNLIIRVVDITYQNNFDSSDNSGGGGGGGGGGGAAPPPVEPETGKPFPTATYARDDIPDKIMKQYGKGCVIAILSALDKLYGGNRSANDFNDEYWDTYKLDVYTKGMHTSNVGPFTYRFFDMDPFISFTDAIDRGFTVITDKEGSGGFTHNIWIVGYLPNGYLVCIDPQDGEQASISPSAVGLNYKWMIIGRK